MDPDETLQLTVCVCKRSFGCLVAVSSSSRQCWEKYRTASGRSELYFTTSMLLVLVRRVVDVITGTVIIVI